MSGRNVASTDRWLGCRAELGSLRHAGYGGRMFTPAASARADGDRLAVDGRPGQRDDGAPASPRAGRPVVGHARGGMPR